MRRRAFTVVDLGFGDAGKGVVTDFLTRELGAHTVVRFNGGAQAGHNVTTADGRHHTFSQLGSGSFVPGTRTHLASPVVVHPTALLVEARRLAESGVPDPLARLSVDAECLVTTPFHQAAGRLRELARGGERHGSCGAGVGETVRAALEQPGEAIRAGELARPAGLLRRLERLRARVREEFGETLRLIGDRPLAARELLLLEEPQVPERWLAALAPWSQVAVTGRGALAELLARPGAVIFEGAQGVLLDEWRGFHPHTTWSTCTDTPARRLLKEAGWDGELTRLGVVRTYATRHGEGPFPTEDPELDALLPEPHNADEGWQGGFRRGWLDLVLLRYALLANSGVDALAVTHLDRLAALPEWRACTGYLLDGALPGELVEADPARPDRVHALRLSPREDLEHQQRLTGLLARARPAPLAVNDPGHHAEQVIVRIEEALGVPVCLGFSGPRAADGAWRPGS